MPGNIIVAFILGILNMGVFIGAVVGKPAVMGAIIKPTGESAPTASGTGRRGKVQPPGFSQLFGFWRNRNSFHLLLVLLGSICVIPTGVVVTWANSDAGKAYYPYTPSPTRAPRTPSPPRTPVPPRTPQPPGPTAAPPTPEPTPNPTPIPDDGPGSIGYAASLMVAPGIVAIINMFITAFVAGFNIRLSMPWQDGYAGVAKQDAYIQKATMVWCILANLIGWITHAKLVHDAKKWPTPEDLDPALNASMLFAVGYNFLLIFWFCFITYCTKADHHNYICPVCEGSKVIPRQDSPVSPPSSPGVGPNVGMTVVQAQQNAAPLLGHNTATKECPACHGQGETWHNP